MNQFLIKNFYKAKAVKVILIDSDKRVKTKFVIPDCDTVTIAHKSFVLNSDLTYYSEGFPTYVFNFKDTQPLNLLNLKESDVLPTDLYTILESHIGRDIANASKGNRMELGLLLSGVCIVGLVYIYYLLTKNFDTINTALEQINEILNTAGEVTP